MKCKALRAAPSFGAHVEKGKQRLKGEHRAKINVKAECSVDIDTHGPPSKHREKRWDYVIVNHDDAGHGVEVHPATAREVDAMIEKKRWAAQLLSAEAKGMTLAKWHWVASGKVDIRGHDSARKRLALAGIAFPREHIEIP